MKLQGYIVIFSIIILPIVLVLSVYLHGQIDTIALQTQIDNNLLNATYDAVLALERNTANEDLSTVSDELRSMIEASISIFMNTMSTSMGMSNANEDYIRPYVPALLYTLYDGFYIYSPTNVPIVLVDGHGNAKKDDYGQILYKKSGGGEIADPNLAETKIDYVLKPYIYYNANYVNDDINVSVNYSLDNYISITGTIGNVYYSKSGYLIDTSLVSGIYLESEIDVENGKIKDLVFNEYDSKLNTEEQQFYDKYDDIIHELNNNKNLLDYQNEELIEEFCKVDGIKLRLVLNLKDENNKNLEIKNDPWLEYQGKKTLIKSEIEKYKDASSIDELNIKLQYENYQEQNQQALDAICYYGKSYLFTKWVNKNLKEINPSKHLKNYTADYVTDYLSNENTTKYLKVDANIFDFNGIDPEDPKSDFYNHRIEVIKSAIQYNLNSAISNYNYISEGNGINYDFEMPILSEEEWQKVLSNISMISFFQGYPCKAKMYNNYSVVSSTSSEMIVNPGNLFFVLRSQANNGDIVNVYTKYHRIDCEELNEPEGDDAYLGFKSIAYVYDRYLKKGEQKYSYDHKNFGCYSCIINGNYEIKAELSGLSDAKKIAYYTVLGKERYRLHKTTATVNNYGFFIKTAENGGAFSGGNISIDSTQSGKEIKSIEIVIGNTVGTKKTVAIGKLKLSIGGKDKVVNVSANQKTNQTIIWDNVNVDGSANSISINQVEKREFE